MCLQFCIESKEELNNNVASGIRDDNSSYLGWIQRQECCKFTTFGKLESLVLVLTTRNDSFSAARCAWRVNVTQIMLARLNMPAL